jgi:nitroreductase
VKSIAKKYLSPSALQLIGRAARPLENTIEFALDAVRYNKYSSYRDGVANHRSAAGKLEAQITKDYHRIEKGLTLPSPRKPFGSDAEKRLRALLPAARRLDPSAEYVRYAEDALAALDDWNTAGQFSDIVAPASQYSPTSISNEDFEHFFQSRRSVRNYEAEHDVAPEVLKKATAWAINSPSVCNRQAWAVRYFSDRIQVQEILNLQNGNAGFRDTVPTIAVISTNSEMFTGATERNQRWVDGGLFAMSLVWALHAHGVQTCMLNWSSTNSQSKKLRKVANIEENEDIIVLIAIGHGLPDHRIARSERRSIFSVIKHL